MRIFRNLVLGTECALPTAVFENSDDTGREVGIRTLGVSLVAIAAIAVSLTLVRYRSEQRELGALPSPNLQPAPVDLNLEAIRTAGL